MVPSQEAPVPSLVDSAIDGAVRGTHEDLRNENLGLRTKHSRLAFENKRLKTERDHMKEMLTRMSWQVEDLLAEIRGVTTADSSLDKPERGADLESENRQLQNCIKSLRTD